MHMATTAKISESAPRAHRDQAGQAGIATRCPSTIPPRMPTCMARPQCCTDAPETGREYHQIYILSTILVS